MGRGGSSRSSAEPSGTQIGGRRPFRPPVGSRHTTQAAVRRRLLPTVIVVSLAAGAGACGEGAKSSSTAARLATQAPAPIPKSQFARNADFAFGVFHRYVYGPYKTGAFSRRVASATFGRAAAAALLSSRELAQTATLIRGTRLGTLFGPMTLVASRLEALHGELARGRYRPRDIEAINVGIGQIRAASAYAGVPISDPVMPVQRLG